MESDSWTGKRCKVTGKRCKVPSQVPCHLRHHWTYRHTPPISGVTHLESLGAVAAHARRAWCIPTRKEGMVYSDGQNSPEYVYEA